MNPRLPVVSGAAVSKALQLRGFEVVSQKGSHRKLCNAEGRTVIVPLHSSVAPGTLRSIVRQGGLTAEEFMDLL